MIDSQLIVGWFETHSPALVLYARQWVDRAAAEDVVHDVFVRLIGSQKIPDDPPAFLFRSVRNAAISQSRSIFRRKNREVKKSSPDWFEVRVEDLVDANSAQEILETLPQDQREIVILRIWAGLGFQQIADAIGISVSTAFERYKTALSNVKLKMETKRCPTNSLAKKT